MALPGGFPQTGSIGSIPQHEMPTGLPPHLSAPFMCPVGSNVSLPLPPGFALVETDAFRVIYSDQPAILRFEPPRSGRFETTLVPLAALSLSNSEAHALLQHGNFNLKGWTSDEVLSVQPPAGTVAALVEFQSLPEQSEHGWFHCLLGWPAKHPGKRILRTLLVCDCKLDLIFCSTSNATFLRSQGFVPVKWNNCHEGIFFQIGQHGLTVKVAYPRDWRPDKDFWFRPGYGSDAPAFILPARSATPAKGAAPPQMIRGGEVNKGGDSWFELQLALCYGKPALPPSSQGDYASSGLFEARSCVANPSSFDMEAGFQSDGSNGGSTGGMLTSPPGTKRRRAGSVSSLNTDPGSVSSVAGEKPEGLLPGTGDSSCITRRLQNMVLSDEQLALFRKQGYLVLENLLTPAQIHQWRTTLLTAVEERGGQHVKLAHSKKDRMLIPTKAHEKLYSATRQCVLQLIETSPACKVLYMALAQVAGYWVHQLYPNVSAVRMYSDCTSFVEPWANPRALHVEDAWWAFYSAFATTFSIALDDLDQAAGCPFILPGSQTIMTEKLRRQQVIANPHGIPGRLSELFSQHPELSNISPEAVPLKAGSGVLYSSLVCICYGPNLSTTRRVAASVNLMPDRCVFNGKASILSAKQLAEYVPGQTRLVDDKHYPMVYDSKAPSLSSTPANSPLHNLPSLVSGSTPQALVQGIGGPMKSVNAALAAAAAASISSPLPSALANPPPACAPTDDLLANTVSLFAAAIAANPLSTPTGNGTPDAGISAFAAALAGDPHFAMQR